MPSALAKLRRELPDGAVVVEYVGPSVMEHQHQRHNDDCPQAPGQGPDADKSLLGVLTLVAQVSAPTSWNPSQTFYVWRVTK
jgi:hypothetical protein